MAVVAPPPIQSKLDSWGLNNNSPLDPLQSSEQMTTIMAYQYPPPPPPSGHDMEMQSSSYLQGYSVPPPGSTLDMRPGHDSAMSLKDRKESLSQASMKLKRSLSTPNARSQPPPEHPSMGLPGEKRRNKLGYHRTSVACGHCRRRKIRCILSPSDVQGRCVNCIRLKKECSFFPVDQQPPTDPRSKMPQRSATGPKIASASSSPAIPSGHPSDMSHQPYPPLSMPPIHPMAPPNMKTPGSDAYSAEAKMPPTATATGRQFDFGTQPLPNWMGQDAGPGSATKQSELNANWRSYPHESPITPSFSPYTPHPPAQSTGWNAPVGAEATPRDQQLPWTPFPAPTPRSISFGPEAINNHSQGQYPPASNRPYERKTLSDIYTSPISTTVPGVDSVQGSTTLEHPVSLSAGAVPSSNYGAWQPHYSYSKTADSYSGGWSYGEHGGSAPVQHEEHVQAAENQPGQPGLFYPQR